MHHAGFGVVRNLASTERGYDLHELLSALQKCIRRGMEYEAVHFALELEELEIWSHHIME